MRHVDLFSGIGGFALAARMAGLKTVGLCEIDPWARRVLAKNFPLVPIHDDAWTLEPSRFQPVDVLTGGYPCQPFSLAGKRRGAADHRHVWPAMRRVVAQARPAWVVCENVAGHVTLGLDEVLADLENLGYATRAFVIPACAVDAPHRRDRVWIVGNALGEGLEGHAGHVQGQAGGAPDRHAAPAGLCEDVADADPQRLGRGTVEEQAKGRGRPAHPDWWDAEPGVGRVAHGVPARVDRIAGLGNALVPHVAAGILRCVVLHESARPRSTRNN